MNLDSHYAATHEDAAPAIVHKPRRRMRVRHSYPESLIELVGHLRPRMPAREIAAALDIPLSSIYRWAPISAPSTSTGANDRRGVDWNPLLSRCKADGFEVSPSIVEGLSLSPSKVCGEKYPASRSDLRESSLGKSKLDTARSMIERDYFRDIDSRALAAAAGLSRFRFIHAFTETYDISPHQYLLRVRIDAAKRLLASSHETIDVIAAATGFRSGACLNRAFTRMEGKCISRFCRVISPWP